MANPQRPTPHNEDRLPEFTDTTRGRGDDEVRGRGDEDPDDADEFDDDDTEEEPGEEDSF